MGSTEGRERHLRATDPPSAATQMGFISQAQPRRERVSSHRRGETSIARVSRASPDCTQCDSARALASGLRRCEQAGRHGAEFATCWQPAGSCATEPQANPRGLAAKLCAAGRVAAHLLRLDVSCGAGRGAAARDRARVHEPPQIAAEQALRHAAALERHGHGLLVASVLLLAARPRRLQRGVRGKGVRVRALGQLVAHWARCEG